MQFTESTIVGVPLLKVAGDLDHDSKQAVMKALEALFRRPESPRHLLFDLSECEFIDSGGITVLLSMLDRVPADGWLGLIGVASGPGRALMYTGFLDLERVRFFSSIDEAAVEVAAERDLARAQERVDRTAAAREAASGKGASGTRTG